MLRKGHSVDSGNSARNMIHPLYVTSIRLYLTQVHFGKIITWIFPKTGEIMVMNLICT